MTDLPQPQPPAPPPPAAAKTSRLAIAGLILGIAGLCTCGLGAIAGLIMGLVAMKRIRASGGALGGYNMAIAAVVVSACMILVGLLTGLLFLIVVREEVKDWVRDIWDENAQPASPDDFFSYNPSHLMPLPWPRLALGGGGAALPALLNARRQP